MLTWEFGKRIGYCDFETEEGKHHYNLYQGNAYAIIIWEFDNKYQVINFWVDEVHAKKCLGITKGYDNLYSCWENLHFWLDANYDHSFKIAKLLRKAKINFTLEY